ncbi:MAG: 1-acyl-sn-glycerol-3-phosphate acyltransferase [Chloroflexi bacterium]|nr:1-acyl-sn-glycerol-3-phosphate acyltransferase [Chloroflexota bacterium]
MTEGTPLPRERSPRLKRISMAVVRGYFRLFHRYEAIGTENLPPRPPVLALTSHTSLLDVPAFALADPFPGSVLVAKESLLKTPGVKQILHAWGAVPVSRDGQDTGAIREVLRSLKEGRLVAIAAEGTRNRQGGLGATNPVLARLAIQASSSGIPLVPVAAVGTYDLLPPGAIFPRPGKVRVMVGPQFDLSHLRSLPRDEGVKQARHIIRDTLIALLPEGSPDRRRALATPLPEDW